MHVFPQAEGAYACGKLRVLDAYGRDMGLLIVQGDEARPDGQAVCCAIEDQLVMLHRQLGRLRGHAARARACAAFADWDAADAAEECKPWP